jgi:trimeric autotransporter adhesin
MRLRSILPFRMPSRPALAGLGVLALVSTLGIDGCVSYKLTGIYVEPSGGACIAPGSTAQFSAYGTFTEGGHATKTEDISSQVSWASGLPELATVDSSGLATAGTTYVGYTDITASAQGEFGLVWSSAQLTVSDSCVSGTAVRGISAIRILGDQRLASAGDTTKLVAVGQYSSAPWSRDLSQQAKWTSSNPGVATVTPEGLVTAVGAGEATITATQTTEQGTVVTGTTKVQVGGTFTNP